MLMNPKYIVNYIFLAVVFCLASAAHAGIINVPTDQPTIIQAISAAASGDEIRVAAGTYEEVAQIDLGSAKANLTIRGVGSVIVHVPSSALNLIRIDHGVRGILLDNLILERLTSDHDYNRLVELNTDSQSTITNCILRSTASAAGVGILLNWASDVAVKNSTIRDLNPITAWGGGIVFDQPGWDVNMYSDVLVEDCTFGPSLPKWIGCSGFDGQQYDVGNIVVRRTTFMTPNGARPGVNLLGGTNMKYGPSSPQILFEDCTFNGATGAATLEFYYPDPSMKPSSFTLRRCKFNPYDSNGRVLYLDLPTPAVLENVVFAGGHHRELITIWGGTGQATFNQCTLASSGVNDAGTTVATMIGGYANPNTFQIRNSLFYSPSTQGAAFSCSAAPAGQTRTYNIDYSMINHAALTGTSVTLVQGTHVSTAPIQFNNVALADYSLGSASPAQGAGVDLGIISDVLGSPRPNPPATPPDLGAYESVLVPVELATFEIE